MTIRSLMVLSCLLLLTNVLNAQTDTSHLNVATLDKVNTKTFKGLKDKYDKLQKKINKKSFGAIESLEKKEQKVNSKFKSKDSLKYLNLYNEDVKNQYDQLKSSVRNKTNVLSKFPVKQYIPDIDSLQTCLTFFKSQNIASTDKLKVINSLSDKIVGLQSELEKAHNVENFFSERVSVFKEQMSNSKLNKYKKLVNKKAFYYQAQIQEFKIFVSDKDKMKDKILSQIRTSTQFEKFWKKNSYLASLFPSSTIHEDTGQSVTGLQNRYVVQNSLKFKMGKNANSNIDNLTTNSGYSEALISKSISEGENQLTQQKEKLSQLSIMNSDDGEIIPDFKPNSQKTKPFLKRLEYGFTIESQSARYNLPTFSDIGITLGYKMNDACRAGLGLSYKIGWGSIQHLNLTSEGMGLRSYVEIKTPKVAKGKILNGIWFSSGYEYNYMSSFKSLQELHTNVTVWQKSFLMGLSKKYKIGRKEANSQLLYDFLHNSQIPRGTALKFRLGYTF